LVSEANSLAVRRVAFFGVGGEGPARRYLHAAISPLLSARLSGSGAV